MELVGAPVWGDSSRVTLDRHQQIAQIWDWLPAFRAAAEYESLQRAGLALSVSPSALSRSIKLLEDALNLTLFTRSPTGLTLTEEGQRLLVATRDAMRRVHEGLSAHAARRLRAGAVGAVLPEVLCDAALDGLPEWSLQFSPVTVADASERLRRGDLDLVLSLSPSMSSDLQCAPLPPLRMVLALAVGGDRTRAVCLNGFEVSPAEVAGVAASVDQLLTMGKRLKTAVYAPDCCLSADWTTLDQGPSVPVFLVTRSYPAPPGFLPPVAAALAARLDARRR